MDFHFIPVEGKQLLSLLLRPSKWHAIPTTAGNQLHSITVFCVKYVYLSSSLIAMNFALNVMKTGKNSFSMLFSIHFIS